MAFAEDRSPANPRAPRSPAVRRRIKAFPARYPAGRGSHRVHRSCRPSAADGARGRRGISGSRHGDRIPGCPGATGGRDACTARQKPAEAAAADIGDHIACWLARHEHDDGRPGTAGKGEGGPVCDRDGPGPGPQAVRGVSPAIRQCDISGSAPGYAAVERLRDRPQCRRSGWHGRLGPARSLQGRRRSDGGMDGRRSGPRASALHARGG